MDFYRQIRAFLFKLLCVAQVPFRQPAVVSRTKSVAFLRLLYTEKNVSWYLISW